MMLGPWHPQDPSSQSCLGTAGTFPERLEHLGEEAVGRNSLISPCFSSHIIWAVTKCKYSCHQTGTSPKQTLSKQSLGLSSPEN